MPASPSCAFLPPEKIDTPLDHNSMREAGAGIGCGVIRLVGEGECIVEEVLGIAEFFAAESCGQCPACRMETSTLAMMMKKVQSGQGVSDDLVQPLHEWLEIGHHPSHPFVDLLRYPDTALPAR